jgi:hypothetical protein
MFRPNWPSSGVQVVVVKDSSAYCNAVFFHLIVVSSGYFGYVGCTWLPLVLLGSVVVAALSILAGAGVLLCVGLVFLLGREFSCVLAWCSCWGENYVVC